MERAQNQVAGQRSLYGDLHGLLVSDFTDQDNVGVLSENCTKAPGEVKLDFLFDLDLIDPRQAVFDRILDRCDVLCRVLQVVQRRVQRCALAASGRTGDNYDSMRG